MHYESNLSKNEFCQEKKQSHLDTLKVLKLKNMSSEHQIVYSGNIKLAKYLFDNNLAHARIIEIG